MVRGQAHAAATGSGIANKIDYRCPVAAFCDANPTIDLWFWKGGIALCLGRQQATVCPFPDVACHICYPQAVHAKSPRWPQGGVGRAARFGQKRIGSQPTAGRIVTCSANGIVDKAFGGSPLPFGVGRQTPGRARLPR